MHRRILADELDGGAGIEHVEPTVPLSHLVERGDDASFVCDIGDEWKRLATDLMGSRFHRRPVAIEQADDRPFASERASRFLSNAAARSSDDGDFAIEAPHDIPPLDETLTERAMLLTTETIVAVADIHGEPVPRIENRSKG
jgi:hypothetical protein